jgi:hypothetical protein
LGLTFSENALPLVRNGDAVVRLGACPLTPTDFSNEALILWSLRQKERKLANRERTGRDGTIG